MVIRKRAPKACTACRQSKLKCDGVLTFPEKCSRCVKHGALICELDLGSKYNFVKTGGQKVHKSTGNLSDVNGGGIRDIGPNSKPGDIGDNHNRRTSSRSKTMLAQSLPCNGGPMDNKQPLNSRISSSTLTRFEFPCPMTMADQQLKTIVVSGQTIVQLFNIFYSDFYPLFPVITYDYLDPVKLAQNSDMKVLLWAICLVTCDSVAPQLRPALVDYISEELPNDHALGSVDKEICQILALNILCYWQQDDDKLIDGLSVRRSGQALQTALHMGFNRASFPIENFSMERFNPQHVEQAILCWTSCFVCTQTLAYLSGTPCPCPDLNISVFEQLRTVSKTNHYLIPWIDQLVLTNACSKAIQVMGSNLESCDGLLDPSIRGATHRSLLESFSTLQTTLHSFPSIDNDLPYKITEVMAMSYKVLVHSFVLMPDTHPADMETVAIPLYLVTVKSISLLTYITSQSRYSFAIPGYVLKYTTGVMVLLYALTLCPCGKLLDVEGCKKCVGDLFQVMGKINSRTSKRCVEILRLLEEMVKQEPSFNNQPLFHIKTRLGASATYSVMSRIRGAATMEEKIASMHAAANNSAVVNHDTNGIALTELNSTDYLFEDFWNWDVQSFHDSRVP